MTIRVPLAWPPCVCAKVGYSSPTTPCGRAKLAYMAGNPELKPDPTDANTNAIAELNRMLYESPDWYTTIIPLRDGVTVAMRV